MSCRSLAVARSLLRLGPSAVRCRLFRSVRCVSVACLPLFLGLSFFLIKAFQWIRCHVMSPGCGIVAVRSRACLADLPRLSFPILIISCLPPSSPCHPISPVGCLLGSLALTCCVIISSVISDNLLACRPVLRLVLFSPVRSVLPLAIADLPYRSPRLPMLAVINRSALLVARLGAGRGGKPFSSSPARLAAVACLASVSSACVSSLRSALLAWVPPFVSVL